MTRHDSVPTPTSEDAPDPAPGPVPDPGTAGVTDPPVDEPVDEPVTGAPLPPPPGARPGNGGAPGVDPSPASGAGWAAGGTEPVARSGPGRLDGSGPYVRTAVDVLVVGVCMAFVFLQFGPANVLADNTPSGGDMGAHVWGPAYLRDHLLPNLQLSGWSPDWYAGFPAYQFYMVLPSLLIVLLDWGVGGVAAAALAGVAAGALGLAAGEWSSRRMRYLGITLAVVALLCIDLSYGAAFKLVSVSGAVTLPLAAYAFGKLAGLRFPTPAFLAMGTLPFLFYRGYSIYGGNMASTLAGEFAFSISLSLGLLYLGVVFRGLETGRHRALAAALLALCGLCHIIPAFWALAGTAVAVLLRFRRSNAPLGAVLGGVVAGASVVLVGALAVLLAGSAPWNLALVVLGLLVLLATLWLASESVRWLAPVGVVGGLLSSFWVLPFVGRSDFVNDMGWEKLPYDQDGSWWDRFAPYLLTSDLPPHLEENMSFPEYDLRWVIGLALVGIVLSVVMRLKAGWFLALTMLGGGAAFVLAPEGRLWNGRLLPFYYLVAALLALLAVGEVVRFASRRAGSGSLVVSSLGAGAALAAVLVVVGLPLGVVWFSDAYSHVDPDDSSVQVNGHEWPSFSPWKLQASPPSFLDDWAKWNYEGYESKPAYREYHDVVQTMASVGEQQGCGRALWEYERELDRYGTPMALMLLPYWTDGCIGSMEGLFFESSVTTPYHFLMQTELSENPSSAQRDMPYDGFDLDLGVQHLQLMGVRYYMATSETAIQQARQHPDLTQVATSGPWEVYEVAGSDLVAPLSHEPAVLEGVSDSADDWMKEPERYLLDGDWVDEAGWEGATGTPAPEDQARYYGPAVDWFLDPAAWDVPVARGGPDGWQRIGAGERPRSRPVTPAEVSGIESDRDSIAFDVDQVGSPVLVKASYFPNWRASGAEGPWRVAPNLMVVVPTETHVELTYGRTTVEWGAYALTAAGIAGLVLLGRQGAYQFRGPSRRPVGAASTRRRVSGGAGPAAEPDAVAPEGVAPDAVAPEAAEPGLAEPEPVEPAVSGPEAAGEIGPPVPPERPGWPDPPEDGREGGSTEDAPPGGDPAGPGPG